MYESKDHSLSRSVLLQERLVSVVYGLLMQSKLHFLTALREGILTHLKTFVKEVNKPSFTHTHNNYVLYMYNVMYICIMYCTCAHACMS